MGSPEKKAVSSERAADLRRKVRDLTWLARGAFPIRPMSGTPTVISVAAIAKLTFTAMATP
jgi:hypothetical protein